MSGKNEPGDEKERAVSKKGRRPYKVNDPEEKENIGGVKRSALPSIR